MHGLSFSAVSKPAERIHDQSRRNGTSFMVERCTSTYRQIQIISPLMVLFSKHTNRVNVFLMMPPQIFHLSKQNAYFHRLDTFYFFQFLFHIFKTVDWMQMNRLNLYTFDTNYFLCFYSITVTAASHSLSIQLHFYAIHTDCIVSNDVFFKYTKMTCFPHLIVFLCGKREEEGGGKRKYFP